MSNKHAGLNNPIKVLLFSENLVTTFRDWAGDDGVVGGDEAISGDGDGAGDDDGAGADDGGAPDADNTGGAVLMEHEMM